MGISMGRQDRDDFDTILIIDDDQLNRKILAKIFSDCYAIREAASGSAGLSEILTDQRRFCAVLLDVVMPGMDGIEVLRHLEKMRLLEEIPVFLITAEDAGGIEREAYQLGVMDVIRKPVAPHVVLRRVQSVIELFAARKRLHHMVETQKSELMKQADRIVQLNRGMIEALATAIEFRNEESGAHVNRIYSITKLMLEKTELGEGLSREDIDSISLASIVHDVGKIAIPDAILGKQGKLTAEEYAIMRSHTVQGVVLLERIPQLQESAVYGYACDIACHHHERWDGKGYPDRLKGEEISLWSQIVSLADVYDALRSKRVYKEAYDRKRVLEMILAGECGAFNPCLLDTFFTVEDEVDRMYLAGEA